MKPRLRLRVIVTILALFVGMGMVLSAVQASDMAVKMAAAGDSGSFGANGCTACGGDDGNGNQADCPPACVAAAIGLLPAQSAIAVNVADSPSFASAVPPRGSAGAPDPSPPRLSIHG